MSLETDIEQMPLKEKLLIGAGVVIAGVYLWNRMSANSGMSSTTAPTSTSTGSSGSLGSWYGGGGSSGGSGSSGSGSGGSTSGSLPTGSSSGSLPTGSSSTGSGGSTTVVQTPPPYVPPTTTVTAPSTVISPASLTTGPNGQLVFTNPNATRPAPNPNATIVYNQNGMTGPGAPDTTGIPSNLATAFHQAQVAAYQQNGSAESPSSAVAQNLAIFQQDAVPIANNGQYGTISPGQIVLSSTGDGHGNASSYYIENINGQLYKGQVPVALAPFSSTNAVTPKSYANPTKQATQPYTASNNVGSHSNTSSSSGSGGVLPAPPASYSAGTSVYGSGSSTPTKSTTTIHNVVGSGQTGATGPNGTNPHNAFVANSNGTVTMYDQYGIPSTWSYSQAKSLGYTGPAPSSTPSYGNSGGHHSGGGSSYSAPSNNSSSSSPASNNSASNNSSASSSSSGSSGGWHPANATRNSNGSWTVHTWGGGTSTVSAASAKTYGWS
ncbi:hypothetical protein LLE49_20025 [Alicyclobacillus tolerans]|uniref:hypothetical protein n=1 Tax=Alicyclobacillus tolerans TaxID=90970 RepID=UPI001F213390|nr:hypothetical protein [Alicyclobacillus tolerans]MCF8567012.1 hypothetical protein [Alicyclobacillus tolerans]